jgi:hypothetical protein
MIENGQQTSAANMAHAQEIKLAIGVMVTAHDGCVTLRSGAMAAEAALAQCRIESELEDEYHGRDELRRLRRLRYLTLYVGAAWCMVSAKESAQLEKFGIKTRDQTEGEIEAAKRVASDAERLAIELKSGLLIMGYRHLMLARVTINATAPLAECHVLPSVEPGPLLCIGNASCLIEKTEVDRLRAAGVPVLNSAAMN